MLKALRNHLLMVGTAEVLVDAARWCVLSYEIEVGSLCDALGIVVKDVFGDVTLIRAADRGRDEEWRRWALFGLETLTPENIAQARIFVPPPTPRLLESPPLERVVFLRDEMANLCWAVERTIAPPAASDPAPAAGATARYRLGTDAPLNWRPFVPVRVPGSLRSVRLQRARPPLGLSDPLGKIIAEPGPFFINEEDVPRALGASSCGRCSVPAGRTAASSSGSGAGR